MGNIKKVFAHIDDLFKLPMCSEDDFHHLRMIYDRVFANVCGLESLGINTSQYGHFLILVDISKLLAEVRLQIAWVSVKKVEVVLTVIKAEVEAREVSDAVKVTKQRHVMSQRAILTLSIVSAFVVTDGSTNKINCVYLKGNYSWVLCEVITNVNTHSDLLCKEGRCFLCLSRDHCVSQYTSAS